MQSNHQKQMQQRAVIKAILKTLDAEIEAFSSFLNVHASEADLKAQQKRINHLVIQAINEQFRVPPKEELEN